MKWLQRLKKYFEYKPPIIIHNCELCGVQENQLHSSWCRYWGLKFMPYAIPQRRDETTRPRCVYCRAEDGQLHLAWCRHKGTIYRIGTK